MEEFLTIKSVTGCTERTVSTYRWWLQKSVAFTQGTANDTNPVSRVTVLKYLTALSNGKKLSPNYRHQAFRTLRTFVKWCVSVGFSSDDLRGVKVKKPDALPDCPTEGEVRAVLKACRGLPSELRNRAVILTLADTAIRASELSHLLVEHWRPQERTISVRGGKGKKDRVVPFGPTTARAIRSYLGTRRGFDGADYLFVCEKGLGEGQAPITERNLVCMLHRLSKRAGLERKQYLHPHLLRAFAATSWIKAGAPLDVVRRMLGYTSLHTTLLYSRLVGSDLVEAHRAASAVERMGLE